MKSISSTLEKIGQKYYLNVPEAIVELMGWVEGNTLLVPFHDIAQKEEPSREKELEKEINNQEVDFHGQTRIITRQDVINLFNNPTPDLYNFRTAYIERNGEKLGSKAVFCKILKCELKEFNTVTAEWYLRKLGFPSKRSYDRNTK